MSDTRGKIIEALGEASMCWSNPEGSGVFNSGKVIEIADKLHDEIMGVACNLTLPNPSPWISVKDSLPEKGGFYIATFFHPATCDRIVGERYFHPVYSWTPHDLDPTHWQPLPPPPEEYEKYYKCLVEAAYEPKDKERECDE